MKKVTLQDVFEFLNFRSVCELYRIAFKHWVKPGGVYIIEAKEEDLATIGY